MQENIFCVLLQFKKDRIINSKKFADFQFLSNSKKN